MEGWALIWVSGGVEGWGRCVEEKGWASGEVREREGWGHGRSVGVEGWGHASPPQSRYTRSETLV